MLRFLLCISLLLLHLPGMGDEKISYAKEILPILSENCFHCHGPDAADRKAGLRMDTEDGATADLGGYAAVVKGSAENSEMIHRIFSDDEDELMPPPKDGKHLTADQKQLIRQWINEGAEWQEHWSFVKPERTAVPKVEGTKNPIDAFIGKRLDREGFEFSPEASPEKLARRLSLDLTGLPPTLEEIEQFITLYRAEGDAGYLKFVDQLMSSPRYGEHMALPWLDASRFADTDGYQFDGPRYMWRWRDWVIDAYNAKMPFDQFTIDQLAGDLLPNATLEQKIATGFNRNHRYNSEEGLVEEEFLLENAVDRVDTATTLWMGLTVGCARCHDHKYDPISQKDYYQLIAFFNSIPEAGRAIKNGNSEPILVAPTKDQQPVLAEKEKRVADLRKALAPGEKMQSGGPLIDRGLLNQFELKKLPTENAKVTGNVTFSNKAAYFDGSSDLSLSGIKKDFNLKTSSHFSVSLWVKPADLEDGIILSRQTGGDSRKGIELMIADGGKLRFDLISRWISGSGRTTTKQKLTPNKWFHVTVSNDGSQSAHGQKIYLNGKAVETEVTFNTNSNIGGVDAKLPVILGNGSRNGAVRFRGAIRDVRLYSKTLWPEEVDILAAEYGGPKRQNFSRIKMTPGYAAYRKAREELEKYTASLPNLMVMEENPVPKETFIRNRGIYNDYGEKVERKVPEKLPPMNQDLPRNRLGLAKWLLSPDHPLTARVAVNRYWQKYFGTGLVKTAEDFGVQGEAPSHPELLDWLAVEFRESGWNVAAMQKLIVSSRTYRQQSRVTADHLERDPENRLLARATRLRLTGHAMRDQALHVAGLLHEQIGGPSVSPYQPANLWAEMSMGMKYNQSKGNDLYRRSVYTIWKRTVAPPTMAVFDAADREACWVSRKQTNTPLQALTLLNETGFVESARHLAVRILTEGGDDPVGWGFRTVTAREPMEKERNLFESALTEYRAEFNQDAEAATKLISTGDSPPNEDFPATEIAAFTAFANVLLNLDETIVRE